MRQVERETQMMEWKGGEIKFLTKRSDPLLFPFCSFQRANNNIYIYMQLAFRLADFDRAWG